MPRAEAPPCKLTAREFAQTLRLTWKLAKYLTTSSPERPCCCKHLAWERHSSSYDSQCSATVPPGRRMPKSAIDFSWLSKASWNEGGLLEYSNSQQHASSVGSETPPWLLSRTFHPSFLSPRHTRSISGEFLDPPHHSIRA